MGAATSTSSRLRHAPTPDPPAHRHYPHPPHRSVWQRRQDQYGHQGPDDLRPRRGQVLQGRPSVGPSMSSSPGTTTTPRGSIPTGASTDFVLPRRSRRRGHRGQPSQPPEPPAAGQLRHRGCRGRRRAVLNGQATVTPRPAPSRGGGPPAACRRLGAIRARTSGRLSLIAYSSRCQPSLDPIRLRR